MTTVANKFFLLIFLILLTGCNTKTLNISPNNILINFNNKNLKNISKKYQDIDSYTNFAIKFFGDSHTATDDIASAIRNGLFNENSIGFANAILPKYHRLKLLKYTSSDFKILNSQFNKFNDYPLCGIVAKSDKKYANINLKLDTKIDNDMIFEILYKSKDYGNIISIKDAKNKISYIQNSKNNIWQFEKFNLTFPINITALRENVMIGGYKIYKKNGAKFADICGLNGAHFNIYQKWDKKAFSRDLKTFNYDILVVAYGTNDAYNDALNKNTLYQDGKNFINLLKKTQPNAVILMLSPPTTFKKNFKIVQQVIKKIAKEERLLFYDIDLFMKLTGSKGKWIKDGLSQKDVHLTQKGYIKVGKAIARELRNLFKK